MTGAAGTLRLGVAGARRGDRLARVLPHVPGAELVALYDPAPEARGRFADAWPAVELAATYADLVDRDIDAVYLASPQQHHAPQAILALDRGLHVLSEIPAVVSIEQAHALVAAQRRSRAVYMLAENHCYIPGCLVVEEMLRAGLFGEVHYAEAEYLYEARDRIRDADGRPTWRAHWQFGTNAVTYPTHALGPLLRWLRTRLVSVMAIGAGHSTDLAMDDSLLLVGRTAGHGVVRARMDLLSRRPPEPAYYAIQGTGGCFESGRGPLDRPRVYLDGRSPRHQWEPLSAYTDRFMPDRFRLLAEDDGLWRSPLGPALDFAHAISGATSAAIDVYEGLDSTLPGIASEASIAQGGSWVAVPDPRFFTDGITAEPGPTETSAPRETPGRGR